MKGPEWEQLYLNHLNADSIVFNRRPRGGYRSYRGCRWTLCLLEKIDARGSRMQVDVKNGFGRLVFGRWRFRAIRSLAGPKFLELFVCEIEIILIYIDLYWSDRNSKYLAIAIGRLFSLVRINSETQCSTYSQRKPDNWQAISLRNGDARIMSSLILFLIILQGTPRAIFRI